MCYSESGIAENNTIFHTKEYLGKTVVWTCITYEPDTFIEYLIVSRKDAVTRLSISLEKKSDKKTAVTWKMLYTLTSPLTRHHMKKTFSKENVNKMMKNREREINYYLSHEKMIAT